MFSRFSLRLGFLPLVAASLLLGACEQNEPDPEPRDATWENVREVFDAAGCASESCHGGGAPEANLALDGTDTDAWEQLVMAPCDNHGADDQGMVRVAPDDIESSFLWTKLTLPSYDSDLGAQMPITGEPLSDEDLDLVRRWIERGAPLSE
jgi:hypothetical protein